MGEKDGFLLKTWRFFKVEAIHMSRKKGENTRIKDQKMEEIVKDDSKKRITAKEIVISYGR